MDFSHTSAGCHRVLFYQKYYFMFSNKLKQAIFVVVLWSLATGRSEAQAPLGVRAQGMAGAFVGVADDATAVYWNPAGLATGSFVSFILDYGEVETVPTGVDAGKGAERQTGGIVAFSAPPLGLAYYRLTNYVAGPLEAAVPGVPGREEVRRSVYALRTSVFGATLLQSIGDYVVVGGTLKLIQGEVARGTVSVVRPGEALDAAADLPAQGHSVGDVDLAAMMAVEHVRLGAVARNLTTPSFSVADSSGEAVELSREYRAGAAWGSGWPGASRVVVAVDSDVTRRQTPAGDRRDLAAGVETWWLGQRLGVRGGINRSTVGEARTQVATGVSAAVKAGMFLEAHVSAGDADQHAWSLGARFTF